MDIFFKPFIRDRRLIEIKYLNENVILEVDSPITFQNYAQLLRTFNHLTSLGMKIYWITHGRNDLLCSQMQTSAWGFRRTVKSYIRATSKHSSFGQIVSNFDRIKEEKLCETKAMWLKLALNPIREWRRRRNWLTRWVGLNQVVTNKEQESKRANA